MKYIDLRSDTVTKPSKSMREAIFNAEVGDDIFGEDPSVNRLQEKCSILTGKQKALFVSSGCLGNQLAIKSHTDPGDEVICESEAHVFNYETAAPSVISRIQMVTIEGDRGAMNVDDIRKKVRSKEYYFPVSRLIFLENTHNRAGGAILPIDNIKEISDFARENGIKIHLDGARIFNAYVETGITVKEYASYFDSISFCFSKGLGAPVGSILCGEEEFINRAYKWRKILGGGMRQAGILASAAIFALDNNIDRLKEDHEKASYFAEVISKLDGIILDASTVQTNIIIFGCSKYSRPALIKILKEKGVLISAGTYDNMRAVFHLDVSMEEVKKAAEIFSSLF